MERRVHSPGDWVATVVTIALLAGLGGAVIAYGRSGGASARRCIPYSTGPVPPGAQCMQLPFEVVGVGPDARTLWLVNADGCFASPSGMSVAVPVTVDETRSTIRIRVSSGGRPVSRHGRLDTSCDQDELIHLRAPIDGRRIDGQSWPTRLRFGALRTGDAGLPRVLGLNPTQAVHLLWVLGVHAQTTGRGKEVVAQVPGWGLADRHDKPIGLRHGAATLTVGDQIENPGPPSTPTGVPTGVLIGRLDFTDKPRAERVTVFDSRGRLLGEVRVPERGAFRLRLRPGRYFLLPRNVSSVLSSPPPVQVLSDKVTRVTVPGDPDYPSVSNGY